MIHMWNIRMRASRQIAPGKHVSKVSNALKAIHISGAEGLYDRTEISRITAQYLTRALEHPRGSPDTIVITFEEIKSPPRQIPALTVVTLSSSSPAEAKKIIAQILLTLGVSKKATVNAFRLLESPRTLRGAALLRMDSGTRGDPDRERGIRVSRLGIERRSKRILGQRLSQLRINTTTVREALVLASKVASHSNVVAEICISDDPDYTTGYLASRELGYLRIPHIKNAGEAHGGRVFFIQESTDVHKLAAFLEETPVVITAGSTVWRNS